jgi:predicted nucleotidyltransferase
MHPHHTQSIQNVAEYFRRDPEVLALLLGGSIAHGFETETSDVDLMIFVSDADYQRRFENNQIHFFNRELTTYDGGYVDGKYSAPGFVKQVIEKGSEPARFAFADSRILFSKINGFAEDICRAAEYPVTQKAERLRRFYAQFEAWHWYCGEALRLKNQYLLGTSVSRFILFSGRLILAYNEMLYPYHKWFFRVLQDAKYQPVDLLPALQALSEFPTSQNIETLYEKIRNFQAWIDDPSFSWPTQFMLDSELNWLDGKTPVDDL